MFRKQIEAASYNLYFILAVARERFFGHASEELDLYNSEMQRILLDMEKLVVEASQGGDSTLVCAVRDALEEYAALQDERIYVGAALR